MINPSSQGFQYPQAQHSAIDWYRIAHLRSLLPPTIRHNSPSNSVLPTIIGPCAISPSPPVSAASFLSCVATHQFNAHNFLNYPICDNLQPTIKPEPKPTQSYIGLIAMAILSTPDHQLVLSDIYQWIMTNYLYFRTRGAGWKNSIRHNLSLNDCFIKSGRCPSGKGHYWTVHPANMADFKKGDFRRRRAQQKVKRYTQQHTLPRRDCHNNHSSGEEDELASSDGICTSFHDVDDDVHRQDEQNNLIVKRKTTRKPFDIETLLGIGNST